MSFDAIRVQLRTRDGRATSAEITSQCYRCVLLLTDALPSAWKHNAEIGWFVATDDESTPSVGQRMLDDFAAAANVSSPRSAYAACPTSAQNETEAVARMRCAVIHMALLGEVDDVVASKASTSGDIGQTLSALAPRTLTAHLTCTRQPMADSCIHHWHYVRKLPCFEPSKVRGAQWRMSLDSAWGMESIGQVLGLLFESSFTPSPLGKPSSPPAPLHPLHQLAHFCVRLDTGLLTSYSGLTSPHSPQLSQPIGLAVSPSKGLYIVDGGLSRVLFMNITSGALSLLHVCVLSV